MIFQEIRGVTPTSEMVQFVRDNPSANEVLCAIHFAGGAAPACAIYAKTQLGVFPEVLEFNRILCGLVYVGLVRMI